MAEVDLAKLPAGQRRWRELVEWAATLDDTAERYFLELKSYIDLSVKRGDGRAKVAKFILGAANRSPEQAVRRFGGHALMILGVERGSINGIPQFEAKDLQQEVVKYCGPDGPEWDFEHIDLGDGKRVVVIVVDPPKIGHEPWACHADGPENLDNGAIYIRADGATRKATGPELHQLHARFKAGTQPRPELRVLVEGHAVRFTCGTSVMEAYIKSVVDELHAALPAPPVEEPRPFKTSSKFEAARIGIDVGTVRALQDALHDMTTPVVGNFLNNIPEPRSVEQYKAEIDQWATQTRDAWAGALDAVMAWAHSPITFRVVNLGEAYLKDLQVDVHIRGAIEGIGSTRGQKFDVKEHLPGPPRKWGPMINPMFSSFAMPAIDFPLGITSPGPIYGQVGYQNGGSVALDFILKELRPERTVSSSDDDVVLIARDHSIVGFDGSWEITAADHHQVFRGGFQVNVTPRAYELDEWMRNALLPAPIDDDD